MSAPTIWYELTWPREVTADQLHQFFSVLTTVSGAPFVLESTSQPGLVIHRLGLLDRDLGGVLAQLRGALPGLGLVKTSRTPVPVKKAWEVRMTSRTRALNTETPEELARATLSALAQVGAGESLTLQWVFGRSLVPTTVARGSAASTETVAGAVVTELLAPEAVLDADERRALRLKRGEHGWRVLGRLGVEADTGSRQYQIVGPGPGRLAGRRGARSAVHLAASLPTTTRCGCTLLALPAPPQPLRVGGRRRIAHRDHGELPGPLDREYAARTQQIDSLVGSGARRRHLSRT